MTARVWPRILPLFSRSFGRLHRVLHPYCSAASSEPGGFGANLPAGLVLRWAAGKCQQQ